MNLYVNNNHFICKQTTVHLCLYKNKRNWENYALVKYQTNNSKTFHGIFSFNVRKSWGEELKPSPSAVPVILEVSLSIKSRFFQFNLLPHIFMNTIICLCMDLGSCCTWFGRHDLKPNISPPT